MLEEKIKRLKQLHQDYRDLQVRYREGKANYEYVKTNVEKLESTHRKFEQDIRDLLLALTRRVKYYPVMDMNELIQTGTFLSENLLLLTLYRGVKREKLLDFFADVLEQAGSETLAEEIRNLPQIVGREKLAKMEELAEKSYMLEKENRMEKLRDVARKLAKELGASGNLRRAIILSAVLFASSALKDEETRRAILEYIDRTLKRDQLRTLKSELNSLEGSLKEHEKLIKDAKAEYEKILEELGIHGSIEDHEHVVKVLEAAKELPAFLEYIRKYKLHPREAVELIQKFKELYSKFGEYALHAPPHNLTPHGILTTIIGSREHAEKLLKLFKIERPEDIKAIEKVWGRVSHHFDAPEDSLRRKLEYYGVNTVHDLEKLARVKMYPENMYKAGSKRWSEYDELAYRLLSGEEVNVGGKRVKVERRGVSHVLLRIQENKHVDRKKVHLKRLARELKRLASSSAS